MKTTIYCIAASLLIAGLTSYQMKKKKLREITGSYIVKTITVDAPSGGKITYQVWSGGSAGEIKK